MQIFFTYFLNRIQIFLPYFLNRIQIVCNVPGDPVYSQLSHELIEQLAGLQLKISCMTDAFNQTFSHFFIQTFIPSPHPVVNTYSKTSSRNVSFQVQPVHELT